MMSPKCRRELRAPAPFRIHCDRVLSIVAVGENWAIFTDRQQGDIRDSGRPAAVRTAKFRAKTRAQNA
jgi:hypothetical protein